jgi:hypothetical protein
MAFSADAIRTRSRGRVANITSQLRPCAGGGATETNNVSSAAGSKSGESAGPPPVAPQTPADGPAAITTSSASASSPPQDYAMSAPSAGAAAGGPILRVHAEILVRACGNHAEHTAAAVRSSTNSVRSPDARTRQSSESGSRLVGQAHRVRSNCAEHLRERLDGRRATASARAIDCPKECSRRGASIFAQKLTTRNRQLGSPPQSTESAAGKARLPCCLHLSSLFGGDG